MQLAQELLQKAEQLSTRGKLRRAETAYTQAAEMLRRAQREQPTVTGLPLPSLPKALVSLGLLLMLRGDTAAAERALAEATDEAAAPNSPWPRRWADPPAEWPMPTLAVALYNLVALLKTLKLRSRPRAAERCEVREAQWRALIEEKGWSAEERACLEVAAATVIGNSAEASVRESMRVLLTSFDSAHTTAMMIPIRTHQYKVVYETSGDAHADLSQLHAARAIAANRAQQLRAWPSGEAPGSLHWRVEFFLQLLGLARWYCAVEPGGAVSALQKSMGLACHADAAQLFAAGGEEWLETDEYADLLEGASCICWDLIVQVRPSQ